MLNLADNRVSVVNSWQTFIHNIGDRWHQFLQFVSNRAHGVLNGITHWNSYLWAQLNQAQHQVLDSLATLTTSVAAADLWQIGLYWILIVVSIAGVIGAFVPALPGITLILVAVIIWGLVQGFAGLGWALGIAIAALLLSVAIDYLAGILGAQKVGASRWGQVGAVVGMVLGFFGLIPALPLGGPIFGILIGTILGAFVGEFLHRRELQLWPRIQQSFRVGIAIIVGTLIGNLLQGVLATIAFIVFLLASWGTVYS